MATVHTHPFTPPPPVEPPAEWQTMTLADMQRQPVNVRWAIWMAYGSSVRQVSHF